MTHQPTTSHADVELESQSGAHVAHMLLRFLLAVRYRKNVVIAAMAACASWAALYYATATRYYGSKAAMLITQTGPDTLNTSITGEESAAPQHHADLRKRDQERQGARRGPGKTRRRRPRRSGRRSQPALDRRPAKQHPLQGRPLHEHPRNRLSLPRPAGGGQRGPGHRRFVPRFHGQDPQRHHGRRGPGPRQGARRRGRQARPQAGRAAGGAAAASRTWDSAPTARRCTRWCSGRSTSTRC